MHSPLIDATRAERLAELSDTDLLAVAYLFDLSLDALFDMREKAREKRAD